MKKLTNLLIVTILLLIGISCEKTNLVPTKQPSADSSNVSKDMVVNNDPSSLNDRLQYTDDTTEYIIEDTAKSTKGGTSSITLRVIATLSSPKYKNETLQANHIRIVGDYAYLGYNTSGERYLGGIDIVNINFNNFSCGPSNVNPKLISSVIFVNPETNKGKDVSSIDVENVSNRNVVWIAGAEEGNDSLQYPALVEKFKLSSDNKFVNSNTRHYYGLDGNVGTDVRIYHHKVYATSGIGGGLTVLDTALNEENFYNLENARSVDVNSYGIVGLGGDPGHLFIPNKLDKTIGGATDPEAKSIVRLSSNSTSKCNYNYALVALGEDGVKCFDLASNTPGESISSLPRPTVPDGQSPLECVTNGVSIHNDWVYIANGAGGLYVAKLNTTDGKLTLLGTIDLGSSVNFVEASSGNDHYLFVATGSGGLKILKVTEKCK